MEQNISMVDLQSIYRIYIQEKPLEFNHFQLSRLLYYQEDATKPQMPVPGDSIYNLITKYINH